MLIVGDRLIQVRLYLISNLSLYFFLIQKSDTHKKECCIWAESRPWLQDCSHVLVVFNMSTFGDHFQVVCGWLSIINNNWQGIVELLQKYYKDPNSRRPTVINFSDVFRTLRLLISSCENLHSQYTLKKRLMKVAIFHKSKHIGFSRVMSLFLACIDTL